MNRCGAVRHAKLIPSNIERLFPTANGIPKTTPTIVLELIFAQRITFLE